MRDQSTTIPIKSKHFFNVAPENFVSFVIAKCTFKIDFFID